LNERGVGEWEIATEPLIKKHAASIDFSSKFFQLSQNPIITDQWLAAKNPTARPVITGVSANAKKDVTSIVTGATSPAAGGG
jgi:hypothetical protein